VRPSRREPAKGISICDERRAGGAAARTNSARAIDNDTDVVLGAMRKIAAMRLDDGVEFNATDAVAESIREDAVYSGVRVSLSGALSRAVLSLHVDVNVGDPIWPQPQTVLLPRLLEGALSLRGYPLEMVLAAVTSIFRLKNPDN